MPWSIKRNPQLPAEPAFHHPDRCLNCGHLDHDDAVGCLEVGGSKYLESEDGKGYEACGCISYIRAPKESNA